MNVSCNRTCFCCSYGDTAPKSIPARLYSILWMLLGMVAFSVLTANFTSSLNYEIEKDLNLFGKKVSSLFMQFKAQVSFPATIILRRKCTDRSTVTWNMKLLSGAN